jgi:type IV fimbrial biogenesis protein FimT
MRIHNGFSLIEVLIAVALASVLMLLAVPAFQTMQARRAVAAAVATFESDFALARSEAIRRGHSVTICNSSDGAQCLGGTSSNVDWTQGWIIYPQTSGSSASTGSSAPASAPLRVQGRLQGIQSVSATDDKFTFRATGLGKATSDSILITPQADASKKRKLCISIAGRLRVVAEGKTQCPN